MKKENDSPDHDIVLIWELTCVVTALCNVHTAHNPTWVLVMTRWLSILDRLGDGITSDVTRQRQVTLALLRRAL